jgi:hypothetical protein
MCISRSALFLLLALLPLTASAEWLEFGAGCPEGSEPLTFHDITLEDLIAFDVELQGLQADTLINNSLPYLRFDRSPGTTTMDFVGYPELPVVVCFVAVPDESDLELTCSAACMESMECLPVYPAPLDSLVSDSTGTPYITEFFRKDSAAYASEEWYPEELAEIVGEFHLRDQRVAIVSVHPVQYLASGDSLRVWSDIELSIGFVGQDPVWSEAGLGYYDLLVGDMLLGYHPDYAPIENSTPTVVRHTNTTVEPSIDPDYVIIVADGLDGTWIDSFADYRSDLNGFNVLITRIDDILEGYGQSWPYPTASIIRDYTEALWEWTTPTTRPTYLLLIGDHEDPPCTTYPGWFLPSKTVLEGDPGEPFAVANDSWYVCFDEPREVFSTLPDMIVGRLSARTDGELQPMLAAIMEYEEEASEPYPPWMARRRELLRLSGQSYVSDPWNPSEQWTASFSDWLGYDYDSYYCGDGEDYPPNADGSHLTSEEWVDVLIGEFEEGFQLGFYTNHGCEHFFSAGINFVNPSVTDFGLPDSCFNCFNVEDLTPPQSGHLSPFLLMLCCSAGGFNHTQTQHLFYDTTGDKYKCYCYSDGHPGEGLDPYDFGTDCLAETFMKNTECGTIGVLGSSNPSNPTFYPTIGREILEAVYYRGLTRIGDAVASYRLNAAHEFYDSDGSGDSFLNEFVRFNLLGDPAVDIGDRVKFPGCCDIIISPADLGMNQYPSMDITGHGEVTLRVTVRNAGAQAAGAFDVDLEITDGSHQPDVLTQRCAGLAAGEVRTLEFEWTTHGWFHTPGALTLTATADDPGGQRPDSWLGNNGATVEIDVLDFYPNEPGWPARTVGSCLAPPALVDIDEDSDLEIIVTSGCFVSAWDLHDPLEPIWMSDPYFMGLSGSTGGYSVPVAGDIDGDGTPEIVMDLRHELVVLNGSNGHEIASMAHSGNRTFFVPHTVTLADVFSENDGLEMAVVFQEEEEDPLSLFILGLDEDQIVILDQEDLATSTSTNYSPDWISAFSSTPDASKELNVAFSWYNNSSGGYHSGVWIYDHVDRTNTSEFIESETWAEDQHIEGIPAVGSLPQVGQQVALSRRRNFEGTHGQDDRIPAILLDPDDLSQQEPCEISPTLSENILCCIMADWMSPPGQADRILATAENQCFAWAATGVTDEDYPIWYDELSGTARPPFPALGNLDDAGVADLLVATREGSVMAFNDAGSPLSSLGFPYYLPSTIYGGFAIADIDNDGYVEVVFGTMDNYLHVWELGECDEGYAPWPQCQHDAARTGVLLEE